MNKGQTQAVTAVLITSITLGAVAATYVWGTPILDKREAEQDVLNAEEQMVELRDEILELSQSGEGASTEYILDLPSDASLVVEEADKLSSESDDREGNYIETELSSSTTPYATDIWFLVEGESLQGLSFGEGVYGIDGSDEEGVVAVEAQGVQDAAVITYRTEFRNMLVDTPTGEAIELVNLEVDGGSEASGETTLNMRNEGTSELTGDEGVELDSGERLDQIKTNIIIDVE